MLRDAIMLVIGFGIGYIVFARPQWVTDAWQSLRNKVGR